MEKTDKNKLKNKKSNFWKYTSFILFIILVSLIVLEINTYPEEPFGIKLNTFSPKAPYHKQIMKIVKPLEYNGFYRVLEPDVHITLDFNKREWTLHNIHHYDEEGNLVLPRGRYGICNELATYVYEKIKHLFDETYELDYMQVAESGFFFAPQSSHSVIRITKYDRPYIYSYILDPSFDRYGPAVDFEDYIFIDSIACKTAPTCLTKDEIVPLNCSSPLIIKKNTLISLLVEDNSNIFNKNNFALAITATKKHRYAGRYLVAIRNNDGELEILTNDELGIKLLGKKEYAKLKNRLQELFDNLVIKLNN
jgi:hypothetical protein